MNVFVLCTGRSGSVTFIRACRHITNFTAGHETRVQALGDARVDFPDRHIEADNRLSWMLGKLGKKYGKEAFYVHLKRDREATAASFNRRWGRVSSIIDAYAEAILLRPREQGLALCVDYVDTVNHNIDYFLRDKPRRMEVTLENARTDFAAFWEAIGAEGDLEAALAEWSVRSNVSRAPSLTDRLRGWLRRI